jgi:hypothetical protein
MSHAHYISRGRFTTDAIKGMMAKPENREEAVCLLKTSSVLIGPANRLNVSGEGCTTLLRPEPVGFTMEVEEPT